MAVPSKVREQVSLKFEVLLPHLNERRLRPGWWGMAEREPWRRLPVSARSRSARGVFELEGGADPLPHGRVRRPGGGR